MARQIILSGRSLLTEKPVLSERITDLELLSADFGGETEIQHIAFDPRHHITDTTTQEVIPLLWMAGKENRRIYCTRSDTIQCIESFPFPTIPGTMKVITECYGIAVLNTPSDSRICFLGISPDYQYPILFHFNYDPNSATPEERFKIVEWYTVSTAGNQYAISFSTTNLGMTEYKNDFMLIGKVGGTTTITILSKDGQILAQHPEFTIEDDIRGVCHNHMRVYTTINGTSHPEIGNRYLAKFLTDIISKENMVPILGLEPFFFSDFSGNLAVYQDQMIAVDKVTVYKYKISYIMFIVDNYPNDDIDLGTALIGEEKVVRVVLKNVADYYRLKDIVLSKADIVCPGGATDCVASECADWIKLSSVNPETAADPTTIWQDQIILSSLPPYMAPDGENEFWVKISIPVNYTNLLEGGNPRPVGVEDGPFVVTLNVQAKVG